MVLLEPFTAEFAEDGRGERREEQIVGGKERREMTQAAGISYCLRA
jgi:hypothetical protein